jgi:catechol 2,3-dioxygenase-like lactoylglutathione lyase family enzyme
MAHEQSGSAQDPAAEPEATTTPITGIHHVTAIAGDPQANLDFYVGVLGLRLVKRTVNFDDPGTYHFYYGDRTGSPGSILTFFPWGRRGAQGKRGLGQVTAISLSVPIGSLSFWRARLRGLHVKASAPFERFGRRGIAFEDPDGIVIELVADAEAPANHAQSIPVPAETAIRGIHSVLLAEEGFAGTAQVLEGLLGFRPHDGRGAGPDEGRGPGEGRNSADSRVRFAAASGSGDTAGAEVPDFGPFVDVASLPTAQPGRIGVGTVHHVAFRVPDAEAQQRLRKSLLQHGMNVTPVLDRHYFQSVYFREPGGVIFEVATDGPGFTVDEEAERLGESLQLPRWYEEQRPVLERVLPSVRVPPTLTEEKKI